MTEQETREAREWAEYITAVPKLYGTFSPQARAAARFILDNTPPALPALPDPLFGVRATHPECGEGIVVSPCPDKDGEVQFIYQFDETSDGTSYQWVEPSTLTFHTPEVPEAEDDLKETLDQVRDALTKIDRLGNDAWDVWEQDANMYEQGRSDAYDHAHTIITEALGDTPGSHPRSS